MQNNIFSDDFVRYILSVSDPFALVLWVYGFLETNDLVALFAERLERQNCSYAHPYLPYSFQRFCTILDTSFEGGLTSYNGVPSQILTETGQSHGKDYILDLFTNLSFDVNHGLLYMNIPEVSNMTNETSVPTGSSTNENHDSLRDSVMQERHINNSNIEEAEDEAMVYPPNNQAADVENGDENSLSHVIDSTFGNTGSPLSSTSSLSDTESCPYCGRTSSRPYNLRSHILTHFRDRIKRFKCPCCSQRFDRPSDMERHYDSIHLGKRFVCQCGKGYTRKDNLKKHKEREH